MEDVSAFPGASFLFCPAFSYPHIFMSLCYRYWQAPLLRAGLSLLSSLGSIPGIWARMGCEAVLRLVGLETWLGCRVGEQVGK